MVSTLDVECELVGLIEFIETGLLPMSLAKRLGHFPPRELNMALRDILDWLSLRGIVRGRAVDLHDLVHPLAGKVLGRLESLSQYLCAPDGCLAFRVEVDAQARETLEDFVKEHIWHPAWAARNHTRILPARNSTLLFADEPLAIG
jgi:hypothetical protein